MWRQARTGRTFAIWPSVLLRARLRALGWIVVVLAVLSAASVAVSPARVWAGEKIAAAQVTPAEASYENPKQAALLKRQISALALQKKGMTDIYAIGVASWATQDVFRKELDGALASIGRTLSLNGGTVRLINHPETAQAIPLASRQNFAAAVRAVGRIMDKEEDVLILFITSHGDADGIGLQLPSILVNLGPAEVAAVLNKEGIKNRVVIVSACYAGIFMEPLVNDNTIVLTAADAKSSSFGCVAGREWTYFGDAFFNQSLKPGTDFKRAFSNAKILIEGWEKLDHVKPSNPQAYFGDALVRKLEPLFEAMAQSGQ